MLKEKKLEFGRKIESTIQELQKNFEKKKNYSDKDSEEIKVWGELHQKIQEIPNPNSKTIALKGYYDALNKRLTYIREREKLIPKDEAQMELDTFLIYVKKNLLLLPTRLAPELEGMDRIDMEIQIKKSVESLLSVFSNFKV